MNESDTRLHKIDPALRSAGWGVAGQSHISTEYYFTQGKISQSIRVKGKKADYVLMYRGQRLAIVEAKADEVGYQEGVRQARETYYEAQRVLYS